MNNKKKVEKCTKLPGGMPLCQEPTFLILYPTLMKDQLEEWRAKSDLVVYIVVMLYLHVLGYSGKGGRHHYL